MLRFGVALAILTAAALSCSKRDQESADDRIAKAPTAVGEGVVLSLALAETRVPLGNYVVLDVKLTNNTKGDLWVNARMLLNQESDGQREVWIMLQGPAGDDIPLECVPKVHPVADADYRILRPNESVDKTELLSTCYRMGRVGHYKMAAFYQDKNPHPPKPPAGSTYLSQLLQSAPVEVDIVAAK